MKGKAHAIGSEHPSDAAVTSRVRRALAEDAGVQDRAVVAVVTQGQVTLYGRGADHDQCARIENIARATPGVDRVRNLLLVDPGGQRDDLSRHARLNDRLREHDEIDTSDVRVSVADKQVLLWGAVRNTEQLRHAERVVRNDYNAMYVRNELTVRSGTE